ncbi:XrtA-associated tyrosine autokinase [Alteromonas gracilis]|uniref:XrtA-associated tyrosine autokinase n=1 Tax=Alteromonas gracilis TaxID=1479524 RepID=UPI0030CD1B9B
MKNTIEKALQKQAEEKQAELENAPGKAGVTPSPNSEESKEVMANTEDNAESQPSNAEAKHPKQALTETANYTQKPKYKLNFSQLEEKGFVSTTGQRKQINEEYREIKRKLLSNAFGPIAKTLHNSNVIMVTSGRPSEGKTFTAANLALSIASEQDKTVLLVDADVLKPNVLRTLGLERRKGLMEYLMGEVEEVADVLYPTNIDTLKIIPAGKFDHRTTELLASQRMHETIDEFANRYKDRVVIIDTPPLIGITESAVLANFAGQAVVVVEEGRSKLNDIKFSIERLNPEMAVGFVVNKSVDSNSLNGYYGYYYAERND